MSRTHLGRVLSLALGLSACANAELAEDEVDAPNQQTQPLKDVAQAREVLNAKYNSLSPDEVNALGSALGGVRACDSPSLGGQKECAYIEFEGGRIYNYNDYSTDGDEAHVMYGDIYRAWLDSGPDYARERDPGLPTTDERGTPDGRGRYNHFAGNGAFSIYWTPEYGAHIVRNGILRGWANSGWEAGPWGYPTGDVYHNPWKNGRCGPNDIVYAMDTQDFEYGFACADLDRSWLVPW